MGTRAAPAPALKRPLFHHTLHAAGGSRSSSHSRHPRSLKHRSTMAGTAGQGLTLAHFTAQLEDLRDISHTLELILSISGTHPRVTLGCVGDEVSLS
jgi:hypothetical protein